MVYQDIVNYIRSARAQGFSDADIRTELLSAGWKEADIGQAFRAAQLLEPTKTTAPQSVTEEEKRKKTQSTPPSTNSSSPTQLVQTVSGERKNASETADETGTESVLPFTWMKYWRDPLKCLSRERYHASLGRAIVHLTASIVLFLTLAALLSFIFNATDYLPAGILPESLPVVLLYLSQVILLSFAFINFQIIASFAYHTVAKMLGGNAAYATTAHVLSVSAASVVFAYAITLSLSGVLAVVLLAAGLDATVVGGAIFILNSIIYLYANTRLLGAFFSSQAKGIVAALALGALHLVLFTACIAIGLMLHGPDTLALFINAIMGMQAPSLLIGAFAIGLLGLQVPLASLSAMLLSLKSAHGFSFTKALTVHMLLLSILLIVLSMALGQADILAVSIASFLP